jgi:hypothetical protein
MQFKITKNSRGNERHIHFVTVVDANLLSKINKISGVSSANIALSDKYK